MRGLVLALLLVGAWLVGSPAAHAHALPCPPGAAATAGGHHHPRPVVGASAGAAEGRVAAEVSSADADRAGLPQGPAHAAAHGCCHAVVTFLPAAEPGAAPLPSPGAIRPPRTLPAAAGLLAFGIYRPPSAA